MKLSLSTISMLILLLCLFRDPFEAASAMQADWVICGLAAAAIARLWLSPSRLERETPARGDGAWRYEDRVLRRPGC